MNTETTNNTGKSVTLAQLYEHGGIATGNSMLYYIKLPTIFYSN